MRVEMGWDKMLWGSAGWLVVLIARGGWVVVLISWGSSSRLGLRR